MYELQEKERIHACMLLGGLDDQDPNDWDDEECKNAASDYPYVPSGAKIAQRLHSGCAFSSAGVDNGQTCQKKIATV